MTSVQQPVQPPQVPSNLSQSAAQAHLPPAPPSGTASPQAAGQAAATRTYASATRKSFSPSSTSGNSLPPVTGGSLAPGQNGKADSVSQMNGKVAIPPAIPSLSSAATVNGNNSVSLPMGQNDHSRKPSVTISAAGASGYIPNGNQVVGKPGGNGIQFGSINANASPIASHSVPQVNQPPNSLSVNSSSNPRITSPQTSPSPIPQPPASGGKPPSSFQGQGNGLSFGSLGGEEPSVGSGSLGLLDNQLTFSQRQLRSMPSGSLTPAMPASHLRRESSQSGHGENAGTGMNTGPGRGGYNQQGGRGRGYDTRYPQPMPFSPGPPNFRPVPNQPRGGQNMGSHFQTQGRPLAYPHSPNQAARSPALAPSQPMHPQSGQLPMPSPQIQHRQYNGYAHPMGPPQVKPHSPSVSSSVSLHKHKTSEQRKSDSFTPPFYNQFPTPNLAPDSGQFEQYLIMRHQNQYGMTQGFDPSYGYYPPAYMHPGMQYMAPPSPQPGSYVPQGAQQQYQLGQYSTPQQPPSMSRTSSAISERPTSSVGPPQTPITPAVSQSAATPRGANSPAPKSTNFQIPSRKAMKIEIKDPNSGAVKTFDKSASSPAPPPTSRSPAVLSNTPTPPPQPPSHADAQHVRTESKSVRTDEEKKNDMRDAIAKKIEADKVEEKRQKEEADAKALKEKEEAEAKLLQEREEAEAKQREAAAAKIAAEEAAKKAEAEAKAAEALAKEEAEKVEKARKEQEDEEEMIRIEEEMEREEREAEERYQKKKQAEKEEKARLEAEAAARADEEMKKAERDAEEAEEARMKMLEGGEPEESRHERAKLFAGLKKEDPAAQQASSPAAAETPTPSGTATPVSDTSSMGPPPRVVSAGKQKPAALKLETTKSVEAPQPSAALQSLRSARFLTSVNDVSYPPSIASPNPALNTAAPMGKFRYDKNFLIQFQTVFTEKPSETWTEKVKETVGDTSDSSARPSSARMPSVLGPRQPSNRPSIPPSFNMGAFGAPPGRTLPPGSTSTDRFQASNQKPSMQNPMRYFPNPPAFGIGSNSQSISRNPSSTGHPQSPRQNQSNRGTGPRGSKGGKGPRENDKDTKTMPITHGQDLKPIQISSTGWKPRSIGASASGMAGPPPGGDGYLAPDVVQRKVKGSLNKMTPNNFDKISAQILDIVSQSKQETDGRTLRQVIQLTFEKATDEAHWAAMYAEFCGRMLEYMTPEIKDETLAVDKYGNVTAGGTLFRKYLLNRCQQDFEQGWKTKLPEKPEGETEEAAMLSDEYYVAAAAKRRGLGLVRFIGELFKLGMLTSRIMHMCVKKLVDFEGMPDEAEVESLTSLLKTIGSNLDNEEKGHPAMDAYFERINIMINFENLPSRLKFMLMVSR